MNDRIQRALDGDAGLDELTPSERAEFEESRSLLSGVVRAIPVPALPPLGALVLDRLDSTHERDAGAPAARHRAKREDAGILSWLWTPRNFSVPLRPAYVLGLAAAVALIFEVRAKQSVLSPQMAKAPASVSPVAPVAPVNNEVLVHFQFTAPAASNVSLAGDFSDWTPKYPMHRSARGVWTIVVPLEPGVHTYSFIVDGEKWVPDPSAPAMADGFGGMNSRIAVLAPDAERSL